MEDVKINFSKITFMRNFKRMTIKDLSKKIKISESNLSKIENGLLNVKETILERISNVLGRTTDYFKESTEYVSGKALFRKTNKLGKKSIIYIESLLINILEDIKVFFEKDFVELKVNFEFIKYTKDKTPKEAALYLRELWKLPDGPINDMVKLLESKGIFVFKFYENVEDSFSGIHLETNGIYVIAINGSHPVDRQRFTLAHELGHIVLEHSSIDILEKNSFSEIERQANEFASEFLMPTRDINKALLLTSSLNEFLKLKYYWKVSISSLIKKSSDLGFINSEKKKSLYVMLSKKNWRKIEPKLKHSENPELLSRIIKHCEDNYKYNKEHFAKLLKYNLKELPKYLFEQETPLILFPNRNID